MPKYNFLHTLEDAAEYSRLINLSILIPIKVLGVDKYLGIASYAGKYRFELCESMRPTDDCRCKYSETRGFYSIKNDNRYYFKIWHRGEIFEIRLNLYGVAGIVGSCKYSTDIGFYEIKNSADHNIVENIHKTFSVKSID